MSKQCQRQSHIIVYLVIGKIHKGACNYKCKGDMRYTNTLSRRIKMHKTQYEIFTLKDNESIQSLITKLQTILNNLRSLGIVISQYDINEKILKTLSQEWNVQELH